MTLPASPQSLAVTRSPQPTPDRTTVVVVADDPITSDGVLAYLHSSPSLDVLDTDRRRSADVALVVAGAVTEQTLAAIERIAKESAAEEQLPVVLVADSISRQLLVRAISHGLVSFLARSGTNLEQTVETLLKARNGQQQLSTPLFTDLVTQIRTSDRDTDDDIDPLALALSRREREVLTLVAEGMPTAEIAAKLNYAERTIKSVLHSVIRRMELKNRAHAVAYAIRVGAI
jgi:DNA-binding NarL/FixJ family response regulator